METVLRLFCSKQAHCKKYYFAYFILKNLFLYNTDPERDIIVIYVYK